MTEVGEYVADHLPEGDQRTLRHALRRCPHGFTAEHTYTADAAPTPPELAGSLLGIAAPPERVEVYCSGPEGVQHHVPPGP